MATAGDSSKPTPTADVCCAAGDGITKRTPYVGTGVVTTFGENGMRLYTNDCDMSKVRHVIIVGYDIFGLDVENTRYNCDKMSRDLDRRDVCVVMPDFFLGKPRSLKGFSGKTPEFIEWVTKEIAKIPDTLNQVIEHLTTLSGNDDLRFAFVGFCFGGKAAIIAAADAHFKATVGIHPAFLTPEEADKALCPLMFLPASDDAPLDDVKAVLDKKEFGDQCVYKVFTTEKHGFCTARGDWENPESTSKQSATEAMDMTVAFLKKHLIVD